MSWGPDSEGFNGVYLGKNVASEAAKALKLALTTITPKVGACRGDRVYRWEAAAVCCCLSGMNICVCSGTRGQVCQV